MSSPDPIKKHYDKDPHKGNQSDDEANKGTETSQGYGRGKEEQDSRKDDQSEAYERSKE